MTEGDVNGETKGLGGTALFQIHISSYFEGSQVYFLLQSICCEMPSASPLYAAEKICPLPLIDLKKSKD